MQKNSWSADIVFFLMKQTFLPVSMSQYKTTVNVETFN